MSQYLMYLNRWHTNASRAALQQCIYIHIELAQAIAWSKQWRKPRLETWSKSSTCAIACAIMEQAHIYAYTHECHSIVYSPFIHSRLHIHIAHTYTYI
jgi:hypothetical protein